MTASSQADITAKHHDLTYVITLRAPDGGNYLTYEGMQGLIAELHAARDSGALLLRIQAEGPDFCLGRLQGEVVPNVSRREALTLIPEANDALVSFPGVSIGQVHGRAYGFGAGLALQCDLTVADTDARFAFDEIDYGLAPLLVAEYLPRYIGDKRALTMVVTGEAIGATTAAAWGMVTHLADRGLVWQEVDRIVSRLSSLEHGAVRLMKQYHRAMANDELVSPRGDAISRLAGWLDDGRPQHPVW